MGLKHWMLPLDQFKTHLFLLIFGWGDPSQLGSWSEGCVKPLKLSREAIWQLSEGPYHTELVSWRVDHFLFCFCFFSTKGGGVRRLGENSSIVFFNPSLVISTVDYNQHSSQSKWIVIQPYILHNMNTYRCFTPVMGDHVKMMVTVLVWSAVMGHVSADMTRWCGSGPVTPGLG